MTNINFISKIFLERRKITINAISDKKVNNYYIQRRPAQKRHRKFHQNL